MSIAAVATHVKNIDAYRINKPLLCNVNQPPDLLFLGGRRSPPLTFLKRSIENTVVTALRTKTNGKPNISVNKPLNSVATIHPMEVEILHLLKPRPTSPDSVRRTAKPAETELLAIMNVKAVAPKIMKWSMLLAKINKRYRKAREADSKTSKVLRLYRSDSLPQTGCVMVDVNWLIANARPISATVMFFDSKYNGSKG